MFLVDDDEASSLKGEFIIFNCWYGSYCIVFFHIYKVMICLLHKVIYWFLMFMQFCQLSVFMFYINGILCLGLGLLEPKIVLLIYISLVTSTLILILHPKIIWMAKHQGASWFHLALNNTTKAELPQEGILFCTQFPSLGIFINKKVGFWKN